MAVPPRLVPRLRRGEQGQAPDLYRGSEFPAARVDACDTCHTYIKSIDLTRDGHAIAMVDEIATVALNIWAEEHDYAKLETNLLSM